MTAAVVPRIGSVGVSEGQRSNRVRVAIADGVIELDWFDQA